MKKNLMIVLAAMVATSCIHISPEKNVARIFEHFDAAEGYEPLSFETFDSENLAISLAADARVDDIWTVSGPIGGESLVGEIKGKGNPDKIILISADMDDEESCTAALEILKTYRNLHIKPNYTLRVAFYDRDMSTVSNYIKEHDEGILFNFQIDAKSVSGKGSFLINENIFFYDKIISVIPPYFAPYGEYSFDYGTERDPSWPLNAPLYRFSVSNGPDREKDLAAATAFVFLMD